ncbi:MAG: cell division protein FtsA [Candidatus Omnitrophota bacterium]
MSLFKTKYICGLDLGASKIAIVLAKIDKNQIEAIYAKSISCQGLKNGVISDPKELTNSISKLIVEIKKITGYKIKSTYVNISGGYLKTKYASSTIALSERSNRVISSYDISRIQKEACNLTLDFEEEAIYKRALDFILDGKNSVLDPHGLYAHTLKVNMYLVTSPVSYISNITTVLNQAGLEVEEILLSGIATSLALSLQEQNLENFALIDIGHDLTEILVFKNNYLEYFDTLPIGGNDITKAIMDNFDLSLMLAQDVKKTYISLPSSQIDQERQVVLKKGVGYLALKQKAIAQIAENQIKLLVSQIKEKINSLPKEIEPPPVVFTGQTALLEGFLEMAESLLGLPVKLGTIREQKFPQLYKSVIFTTSFGLVLYGLKSHQIKKITSMPGLNIAQKTFFKAKEIYQEYF